MGRGYLGASSIGASCLRKIWLDYKGDIEGQVPENVARTAKLGSYIANEVLDYYKVPHCDREQLGMHPTFGWFRGHIDGRKDTTIIEVKTMMQDRFNACVKHGVRKTIPQYYDQIQCYLFFAYLDHRPTENGLFLLVNRNNLKVHEEPIEKDYEQIEKLELKALMIHESKDIPAKISNNPAYFECKTCKYSNYCHESNATLPKGSAEDLFLPFEE